MKVNYSNLEVICDNLSTLYEDGIAINVAISLLMDLDLEKGYKKSLKGIEESILKGNTLSKAFNKYPKLYPPLFIAFINIGEKNGKLSRVLKNLKKYYMKRRTIHSKLISSISYPIFLLVLMFLAAIVLVLFIIPIIYSTMKSVVDNVSTSIESIYKFSEIVKRRPLISLLFFISYAIILPLILKRYLKDKINLNNYLLRMNVYRLYYENLLILILSIIYESGVSISNGIQSCSEHCDEKNIKDELVRINKELMKGEELSNILSQSVFISNSSIAMIKIGEKGGSMDVILRKIEDRTSRDFYNKIDKLLKKIQPTLILTITGVVAIFIYTVILPMFNIMYMR